MACARWLARLPQAEMPASAYVMLVLECRKCLDRAADAGEDNFGPLDWTSKGDFRRLPYAPLSLFCHEAEATDISYDERAFSSSERLPTSPAGSLVQARYSHRSHETPVPALRAVLRAVHRAPYSLTGICSKAPPPTFFSSLAGPAEAAVSSRWATAYHGCRPCCGRRRRSGF